ncbi:MAG: nitrile hydratase subunit alpha, partial [Caldimonas sp.]
MSETGQLHRSVASLEQRVDAVESVLADRGLNPAEFVVEANKAVEERWVAENGARIVAKAWTDPAFRQQLLANGRATVTELGYELPRHHRHLVVLENTPKVHNVICCTLCSCTAFTIIGLPPDWYKDLEYRSRV